MTSQSLSPSSASRVMIMSHCIDLACLGHRKNSLTLHCFLTENSNQSDKISPPYPPGFHTKQGTTHPWIGLGLGSQLTPSKTPSPLFFFSITVFKRKLSRHPSAKSHRYLTIVPPAQMGSESIAHEAEGTELRHRTKINTDQVPKCAPKVQASRGSGGSFQSS